MYIGFFTSEKTILIADRFIAKINRITIVLQKLIAETPRNDLLNEVRWTLVTKNLPFAVPS